MESADMKAEFLHGFCDGKGLEAHITAVVNRPPLPSNFRVGVEDRLRAWADAPPDVVKLRGFSVLLVKWKEELEAVLDVETPSSPLSLSSRTFNHITQDDRGKILIVTLESPDAYFTRDLRGKALALARAKSCVQTATNKSKHAAKDTQTPSTTSPGIGRNDEQSEEKDVSDNKKITRRNDEGSVTSVIDGLLPLQIKVVSAFSLVERARGGCPDAVHALFPPLKEVKNEGGGRMKTVASFIFESKEWKELREGHNRSGGKQHPLKFEVTRTYLKALHDFSTGIYRSLTASSKIKKKKKKMNASPRRRRRMAARALLSWSLVEKILQAKRRESGSGGGGGGEAAAAAIEVERRESYYPEYCKKSLDTATALLTEPLPRPPIITEKKKVANKEEAERRMGGMVAEDSSVSSISSVEKKAIVTLQLAFSKDIEEQINVLCLRKPPKGIGTNNSSKKEEGKEASRLGEEAAAIQTAPLPRCIHSLAVIKDSLMEMTARIFPSWNKGRSGGGEVRAAPPPPPPLSLPSEYNRDEADEGKEGGSGKDEAGATAKVADILERIGCPLPAESVLFLAQSGSYMFNLHTTTSDKDYTIVFAFQESQRVYNGSASQSQYRNHTTRRHTNDKSDVTEYTATEAGEFLEFAIKGNPKNIELFFAERVIYESPEWLRLKKYRKGLLTLRCVNQYRGFIYDRLRVVNDEKSKAYVLPRRLQKEFYYALHKHYDLQRISKGCYPSVEPSNSERDFIMRVRHADTLKGELEPEKLKRMIQRGLDDARENVKRLRPNLPEEVDVNPLCAWLVDLRRSRW